MAIMPARTGGQARPPPRAAKTILSTDVRIAHPYPACHSSTHMSYIGSRGHVNPQRRGGLVAANDVHHSLEPLRSVAMLPSKELDGFDAFVWGSAEPVGQVCLYLRVTVDRGLVYDLLDHMCIISAPADMSIHKDEGGALPASGGSADLRLHTAPTPTGSALWGACVHARLSSQ